MIQIAGWLLTKNICRWYSRGSVYAEGVKLVDTTDLKSVDPLTVVPVQFRPSVPV